MHTQLRQQFKAEKRLKKAQARASMVNPYQVGQIVYDCWGYEQTNVDFYQVVEVKPKSVVLRKIEGKIIPDKGFQVMSGRKVPVKDSFTGAPFTKPLCILVHSSGQVEYYLKSKYGWISNYDKGEAGVSCSWYA